MRNPDVFSGKVPKFLSNFDSFSACSPNTYLRYNFVLQSSSKYNKLKENIFSLTSCQIVAFFRANFYSAMDWAALRVEQRKLTAHGTKLECED